MKTAEFAGGSVQVRDMEEPVVCDLVRKGLIYVEVRGLLNDVCMWFMICTMSFVKGCWKVRYNSFRCKGGAWSVLLNLL